MAAAEDPARDPILLMGHRTLIRKALPVVRFDCPELHALVAQMRSILEVRGLEAIAAPQIGVNVQLTVFGSAESETRAPELYLPRTVLINPVVTPLDQATVEDWEGCASVPGISGRVPRYARVRYQGVDVHGRPIDRIAQDWHARIVQHERDHLDGILFLSRMRDLSSLAFDGLAEPANVADVQRFACLAAAPSASGGAGGDVATPWPDSLTLSEMGFDLDCGAAVGGMGIGGSELGADLCNLSAAELDPDLM